MESNRPTSLARVPDSLRRRFELAHTDLAVAGRHYQLLRPRSVDELISEEDFAIDERIPYWADCWPSARVLADLVSKRAGAGRRMLELGCGIGLPSLVGATVGYQVLATDYYAEALEFTATNAARHDLENVDTRLIDWRKLPDDLETFDLVAAADVLYERPYPALVAAVLAHTLAPAGVAVITDPGRRPAERFIEECSNLGLAADLADLVPTTEGDTRLTITVFEVRRALARAEVPKVAAN